MKILAACLSSALVLTACATSGASDEPRGVAQFEGDPRLGEEARRVCFASSIDDFSDVTDRTVVVHTSPSRSYLLEVFGACFNLDQAMTIGVAARTGCLTKGDTLIVSDSPFGLRDSTGIGPSRCTVKSIYEWDADAEAADEAGEPEDEAA